MASAISIIRGDTQVYTVVIKDSAGDPIDITGWTVYFTARADTPNTSVEDDDDAQIAKVITSFSDPTHGAFTLTLSKSDTDIDAKKYYYDFQVKNAGGEIFSTAKGTLTITADVTRNN